MGMEIMAAMRMVVVMTTIAVRTGVAGSPRLGWTEFSVEAGETSTSSSHLPETDPRAEEEVKIHLTKWNNTSISSVKNYNPGQFGAPMTHLIFTI